MTSTDIVLKYNQKADILKIILNDGLFNLHEKEISKEIFNSNILIGSWNKRLIIIEFVNASNNVASYDILNADITYNTISDAVNIDFVKYDEEFDNIITSGYKYSIGFKKKNGLYVGLEIYGFVFRESDESFSN